MADAETILNDMKDEGVSGAIVQKDGKLLATTIQMDDISAGVLSSLTNISDAILKKQEDKQQLMELRYTDKTIVIIPLSKSRLFGVTTSKEQKQTIIKYAKMASRL